jgi:hypothetical protein
MVDSPMFDYRVIISQENKRTLSRPILEPKEVVEGLDDITESARQWLCELCEDVQIRKQNTGQGRSKWLPL